MTKHLISEAGGINTFITVKEMASPSHAGWKHIRVATTYDAGRDSSYEQVKLELCLDANEFANLKAVINSL